jgi:hypothetical protein
MLSQSVQENSESDGELAVVKLNEQHKKTAGKT